MLDNMAKEAISTLKDEQRVTPWLQAGRGRGGTGRVGGLDWLDWSSEFVPIEGLNQIVGHSSRPDVRTKTAANSYNICIDTHLNHVILMDGDGKIHLKDAEL